MECLTAWLETFPLILRSHWHWQWWSVKYFRFYTVITYLYTCYSWNTTRLIIWYIFSVSQDIWQDAASRSSRSGWWSAAVSCECWQSRRRWCWLWSPPSGRSWTRQPCSPTNTTVRKIGGKREPIILQAVSMRLKSILFRP